MATKNKPQEKKADFDPKSVEEAKKEAVKKKYTEQEFQALYNALCEQTGWTHAARPGLKPMRDLGGALIVCEMGIVPFKAGPK